MVRHFALSLEDFSTFGQYMLHHIYYTCGFLSSAYSHFSSCLRWVRSRIGACARFDPATVMSILRVVATLANTKKKIKYKWVCSIADVYQLSCGAHWGLRQSLERWGFERFRCNPRVYKISTPLNHPRSPLIHTPRV